MTGLVYVFYCGTIILPQSLITIRSANGMLLVLGGDENFKTINRKLFVGLNNIINNGLK